MALNLHLYNFTKRRNSTKRPSGDGQVEEVVLKAGSTIESPVFEISGLVADYKDYNYCKFMNQYYFINDIRLSYAGFLELYCESDVLATFKSEIGDYNAFVERTSDNDHIDSMIEDAFLSNTEDHTHMYHVSKAVKAQTTDGAFILRVVGRGDSSISGINAYVLTESQLKSVLDFMFTDSSFTDILTDETVKSFFNPFQYIVDLRWYPVLPTVLAQGQQTATVKLGWWDTNVTVFKLGGRYLTHHVDMGTVGNYYIDWRRYSPRFSKYSIFLPAYGLAELSPKDVQNGLVVDYHIDCISGNAVIELTSKDATPRILASFPIEYGVQIQLGQITTNLLQSVGQYYGNAFGAIAGALSGNLLGAVKSSISAYTDSVQTVAQPTPSVSGMNGNIATWYTMPNIEFYCVNLGSASYPTNKLGKPCYKNLNLGDVSGYIKCAGASVPLPALASERDKVNSYLNGGFYYE